MSYELDDDTYPILYYNYEVEDVTEGTMTVVGGKVIEEELWDTIVTISYTGTSALIYQVQQLTLNEDGLVEVVALEHPADVSGVSDIAQRHSFRRQWPFKRTSDAVSSTTTNSQKLRPRQLSGQDVQRAERIEMRLLYGSKRFNLKLSLSYNNVDDTVAAEFLGHFDETMGTYKTFEFSPDARVALFAGWQGTAGALDPPQGVNWRYEKAPQIVAVRPGVSNVSVSLIELSKCFTAAPKVRCLSTATVPPR